MRGANWFSGRVLDLRSRGSSLVWASLGTIFGVVILNHIYLPFALGEIIIEYVLYNLHVCPFIARKIIAKITV